MQARQLAMHYKKHWMGQICAQHPYQIADSLLDKGFSQFSESRTKDSKVRHSVSKDHFENNKIDISFILKDKRTAH